MDQNSELRPYMKAIGRESADQLGHHLGHDELIAFKQGNMAASEREAARAHLLRCDQCLAIFRDVNDFFEPRREDEIEMSEFEARRGLRDLRERLRIADILHAVAAQTSAGQPRLNLRLASAIAAGLLIVVTPVGLWALLLRQENQRLAAQVRTLQQESQAHLAQVEEARQHQTDEARRLRENLENLKKQVAALNQPQINITQYELLLAGEARGNNSPYEVKVPPHAQSYLLKILPDKPEEFSSYVVELVGDQNRTAWKSERLKPDPGGSLIVAFSRTFLSEGKYRLRVFGWKGKTTRQVGEYALTLTFLR
jgi:hypothetical protein